jgi:hypothetical protein
VWLWDGGLPGLVAPLHGDGAHAAAMARFFHAHASPVIGIPFDYPRTFVSSLETLRGLDLENFKHPERINYTIQGLFEILVHDVAALVGDESVLQDTYDYIRIHFRAIAGRTLGETGLLIGSSAFPDFPKFMQETGEDLSAYNNGVWYNACRKVERLALLMADEETALLARELAVKIEQSFWQVFWDEETGYLASSADLHGQRRKVYTSTNTFWDFGYGDELCDGYAQRIVAYQLAHFYSKMGISIVSPKHPHVWDGDGNQFHCSWPVLDNHNLKVALQARNAQALAYFVPWVEHLLARHTVPEAIQMRTTKPFPVAYDPGSWQAYTASSWYRAVVESLLGVTLDAGGVTVAGTSAEPMTLSGLHYRDATLTITTRGRGWQIADFRVDGQVLPGTQQAPAYLLTPGSHSLSITRADTPPACWTLLAANGTSVEVRHATAQRWDGEVNGLGLTRLRVYAPGLRCVRIDGQSAAYRGSEWPHVFWIDTDLRPGQVRRVELSASQEQQHD